MWRNSENLVHMSYGVMMEYRVKGRKPKVPSTIVLVFLLEMLQSFTFVLEIEHFPLPYLNVSVHSKKTN